MAIILINVGAAPNDGTGDPNRDAWIKANANFTFLAEQQTDPSAIEAIVNAAIASYFNGLPTTMPSTPGQMWFNDGFLCRT